MQHPSPLKVALFVSAFSAAAAAALPGCARFGAVYPPRPAASPATPVADPAPSRIVTHVSVTSAALRSSLDETVPRTGDGDFQLAGTTRRYAWSRSPLAVGFSQGRLVLDTRVDAKVDVRVSSLDFPIDLKVAAEPVVNTDYKVKLQSIDVKVTSSDRRLRVADSVGGVFEAIRAQVHQKLQEFEYDLKPTLAEAYARVARPLDIPIGEAKGCAMLKVLGVEAGPTVIADGVEKDLALIVAPSVTLPCANPEESLPLPPLANVATITPGPFTVTVPVAASYEELTRAMSVTFTDGKYFFSTDYPKLYLEKPELYESQGMLVLKMHIAGPVHAAGIDTDINGDIFLSGHLSVVDNELRMPDLEPTIETSNFFLSLKAMADVAKIRDQARAALRLDIGERLRTVRSKLSSDLTFGGPRACFKGDVDRIEVTGAYAHGTYVRVYVAVTGRAAAAVPCPNAG
ncbi:DUF4403 family protein [Pendulispora albinea]|uniref:DUF4403 family protein n=1 Tax=Pendulispora albinea TaxID=2741071 RepID=A0ABZ2LPQ1_9BACT